MDAITTILKKAGDASRTARTRADLQRMVSILQSEATVRMRRSMDALDIQRAPPESDVTAMQLCSEVGHVLQDDALAHIVLETLRMRNSLASPSTSLLGQAAKRLVAAGILERTAARSPVFQPIDRYRRAVQGLRALAS